jgi:hypothetical protein
MALVLKYYNMEIRLRIIAGVSKETGFSERQQHKADRLVDKWLASSFYKYIKKEGPKGSSFFIDGCSRLGTIRIPIKIKKRYRVPEAPVPEGGKT